MPRDVARAHATQEFGDVGALRHGLDEMSGGVPRGRARPEWLDSVRRDVLYAARSLRRTPAVSLTVVLTLALGLGVNAAMFSLLDVIFLRPPAGVSHPEQLRRVWSQRTFSTGREFIAGFDYNSYEALASSLASGARSALYSAPSPQALSNDDTPPMAVVSGATTNYFELLGVRPTIGRFFSAEEDRLEAPAPVVVLSDDFWHRHFRGDPHVIGTTLSIADGRYSAVNLRRYTVIGVAAPQFTGVDLDAVDIWRPIAAGLPTNDAMPWYRNPYMNGFEMLLRLQPGANEAELIQRATARLRGPGIWLRQDTTIVGAFGSIIAARGPGKIASSIQVAIRLAGVAVVVLIIACANVINLLLARALRRRREITIRLALGISRARLVRLLVTESVLLSAVAGAAALLAAWWGGAILRRLLLPQVHWGESPMHWRVLGFALIAALTAGALTGLVPALQSLGADLTDSLRAGARSGAMLRSRLRSMLVVAQTGLSVVLLIGAALFIRSFDNARSHDIGYAVDRLAFFGLGSSGLDTAAQRVQSDRLLALEPRFASIPGVERVAYASARPIYSFQIVNYFPDVKVGTGMKPTGIFTAVTPDYFAATGTRILRGRNFSATGRNGSYEVMVNQAMARALWPGESALGKCIRFEKSNAQCAIVVGVTQTAILTSVQEDPSPHMYLPLEHMPFRRNGGRTVILRVDPDRISSVLATMHALLRTEFPAAIPQSTTMVEAMEPLYRPWKLGAMLFTLFSVLALVIAGVGVYSSVSYAVNQRTHEFGVRAALGATARDVIAHVLGSGLRVAVVGIFVGVVSALAGGRLVASLLYGVQPDDVSAMLTAAGVLLVISVVAGLPPAWRATRVDPVEALRAE